MKSALKGAHSSGRARANRVSFSSGTEVSSDIDAERKQSIDEDEASEIASITTTDEEGGVRLAPYEDHMPDESRETAGAATRGETDADDNLREHHSQFRSHPHCGASERIVQSHLETQAVSDEGRRADWRTVISKLFKGLLQTARPTDLTPPQATKKVNSFLKGMHTSPTSLERLRDSIVSVVSCKEGADLLLSHQALASISAVFQPVEDSEVGPGRVSRWIEVGRAVAEASECFKKSSEAFTCNVDRIERATKVSDQHSTQEELRRSASEALEKVNDALDSWTSATALLSREAWYISKDRMNVHKTNLYERNEDLKRIEADLRSKRARLAEREAQISHWEKLYSIENTPRSDLTDCDSLHTPEGSSDDSTV